MIKGVGIDLIESRRFRDNAHVDGILAQILTERELRNVPNHPSQKHISGARLFTIKESIFKAFACGLHWGSYWHDVEIVDETVLPPTGFIGRLVAEQSVSKIHIAHSHSHKFSISFVIIEE